MNKIAIIAVLAAFGQQGVVAEVWKCQQDGRTVYSDVPCTGSGRAMDTRVMNGNVVQAVTRPPAEGPALEGTGSIESMRDLVEPESRTARSNVCPSDLDIRNMETRAGSIRLGPSERKFIRDEVRRARQCAKGQGQYTADDWKISRDAVDEQGSLNHSASSRALAEAMHSGADPIEGDRIEARRNAATLASALRRDRTISNCDAQGCWSQSGLHYLRVPGSTFLTLPGSTKRCLIRADNTLECP